MKSRMLVAGMAIIALAALSGCAGGVNATKSIEFADSNKTIAQEANVEAAQLESANIKLDSAKALQADGDEEEAAALAEQSTLEYKLAIANAELAAAKKEDEKVEKELRGDVERKLLYQNILDQETKNGGAK
ncbi:DUF4398 domain-containing protein [Fibrobacter sp. UWOV1]|jgi:hypothetical protein|uniref:DUF4398 domain-containing protein n=1 Tax=unclassified Fibrobacter TaxID=2634177 RepID=UPI00091ED6F8|nr:DUF4398 domain-containing protein [Fibrobacter sp. UWOV1]SHL83501.1 protein of unknown function [Fibrobacter sp. UWOV1]